MANFAERVYRVVRAVPRGRVISYGGVAALLGTPRAARGVGRALFELPDGTDVPWWRVVNHNGEISIKGVLHGPARQRALLESEGVRFDRRGRIDWKKFGWTADGFHNPDEEDEEGQTTSHDAIPNAPRAVESVAVAIRDAAHPGELLLVRRPPDDPDLPHAWGLPAASRRTGESWEAAARRAGRDKLGVQLEIGAELNRGSTRRRDTQLDMRLFDATIRRGQPHVPQLVAGVTQYTAAKWGPPAALGEAARHGSLCCRLRLELEQDERVSDRGGDRPHAEPG